MHLSLIEILAAFMVLFAIIDIPGSIPIIIDIKAKTGDIKPMKVTLVSFAILGCIPVYRKSPAWNFRNRCILFRNCRFIHHFSDCNGNDTRN